jgi:hypothetical protein
MAIRKFRSVEEMGYHWYQPGDPMLFRAIRRVCELRAPGDVGRGLVDEAGAA